MRRKLSLPLAGMVTLSALIAAPAVAAPVKAAAGPAAFLGG
jgi:hypothetical protein